LKNRSQNFYLANIKIKNLTEEKEALQKRIQELEAKCNLLNKIAYAKKSEQKKKSRTEIIIKKQGAKKEHKGHGRKIPWITCCRRSNRFTP